MAVGAARDGNSRPTAESLVFDSAVRYSMGLADALKFVLIREIRVCTRKEPDMTSGS